MSMKTLHTFHLTNPSPWPLYVSLSAGIFASSLINIFYTYSFAPTQKASVALILSALQWWMDVSKESLSQGWHSQTTQEGLKMSMALLILSETMFFFSFFWPLFHFSLSPSHELGSEWPPFNMQILPYNLVPLLNTYILLTSGFSITWAHHSLMKKKHSDALKSMTWTLILGAYFIFFQMIEYKEAPFTLSDSVYGSIFFLITGFHGLHVIVGSVFIATMTLRLSLGAFSKNHHLGLEFAIWYWHFVDVVWLFLFLTLYWWNSF